MKILRYFWILPFLLTLSCPAETPLKIGWASRDLSTAEPVPIPGQFHKRISTGILDPVTVTALVLENGNDFVCFASIDTTVVSTPFFRKIQEKVRMKNPKIPVNKIIFHATHTHTAPAHYQASWDTDAARSPSVMSWSRYAEFASTKIAEAVCEAYEKRAPGGVSWGFGYAVVSHSRRSVYAGEISKRSTFAMSIDGRGKMYGTADHPSFRHFEAGADHSVQILFTYDPRGKMTGAVINLPAPSQASGNLNMLSADYWNDVRVAIRAKFGNLFLLPQCAAAGDLELRALVNRKAEARRLKLKYGERDSYGNERLRKDLAERIAASFAEIASWAKKDIRTAPVLKHSVRKVMLETRAILPEEAELERKKLSELEKIPFKTDGPEKELIRFNSRLSVQKLRSAAVLTRFAKQKKDEKTPTEIHVVRLGDMAFATNRFELFMDYMHRIQGRSPSEQTFIVQLCGGEYSRAAGYLATERAAANRGYSATLFENRISPRGGQTLVDATVSELQRLFPKTGPGK